jgi:antagonist of KipI
LRVLEGPQAEAFAPSTRELLLHSTWKVSNASDRMGLRLEGPRLAAPEREWVSEGVLLGAIQVPSHGQPIVNFVDHQSTGGYPKLAQVIRADIPRLGQWVPHQSVRFERVSLESAREALRQQEEFLSALG